MVMRGSCTSFAILDGASNDRNPEWNNDLCRKESGKYVSTARPLASRCGTGSGGLKDPDNLRLRLAALARQADVLLLLPPATILQLKSCSTVSTSLMSLLKVMPGWFLQGPELRDWNG